MGDLPSMEALLGRMVMAPTATSSRFKMGEILDPQLSEPTQRKWPVRLAWRVASKTLLVRAELEVSHNLRSFSSLLSDTSHPVFLHPTPH